MLLKSTLSACIEQKTVSAPSSARNKYFAGLASESGSKYPSMLRCLRVSFPLPALSLKKPSELVLFEVDVYPRTTGLGSRAGSPTIETGL